MIQKGIYYTLILAFVSITAMAETQPDSIIVGNDDPHTGLGCFQRPKFFEINYRTLPSIKAYPGEFLTGNEEFETNRLIEAKLSLPIILKDNFKLITQFRYKNEVLNLGENDYYDRKIKLHNSGLTLAYQWFYKDSKYLGGHISGSLKADDYNFQFYSSILDYSGSIVWGEKIGGKNMGIGVILGNSLGRFRVSPLLIYENQISATWHLSMQLPKTITLTKAIIPDDFYLKGSIEAIGASYYLNNSPEGFENIEYRRSAIDIKIGLEKEVKDWLWVGLDAGVYQPLNSIFVGSGKASRFKLHDFRHQVSPFVNLTIFAVPPRSLYSKLK